MRKKAGFTHDMTIFQLDVRGKRFNAHERLQSMEMTSSKDHVAEKPHRGACELHIFIHGFDNIQRNYNFVLWFKTDKNHKLIFRKNHKTHKNLPREIKIIKICIPVPTFPMFSKFFCILLQP